MKAFLLTAAIILCLQSALVASAGDSLLMTINSRMHAAGLYIPDFKVIVENGIATVYGTANSAIQRDEIMEVVSMTYGVRGAVNQLSVGTIK